MTRALLLYGAPGSGKTMLAHAMAHACGARLFNISPRQVEGKYAGKAVTMMLHMVRFHYMIRAMCTHAMKHPAREAELQLHALHSDITLRSCVTMQVFKVAREMGPSVIYLDEAEKV